MKICHGYCCAFSWPVLLLHLSAAEESLSPFQFYRFELFSSTVMGIFKGGIISREKWFSLVLISCSSRTDCLGWTSGVCLIAAAWWLNGEMFLSACLRVPVPADLTAWCAVNELRNYSFSLGFISMSPFELNLLLCVWFEFGIWHRWSQLNHHHPSINICCYSVQLPSPENPGPSIFPSVSLCPKPFFWCKIHAPNPAFSRN